MSRIFFREPEDLPLARRPGHGGGGEAVVALSERTAHTLCTMTCHNTHERTQRRDMFVDDVPLHRESCNYTSTTLLSAAGRLIRLFRRSRLNPSGFVRFGSGTGGKNLRRRFVPTPEDLPRP